MDSIDCRPNHHSYFAFALHHTVHLSSTVIGWADNIDASLQKTASNELSSNSSFSAVMTRIFNISDISQPSSARELLDRRAVYQRILNSTAQ